MTRAVAVRKEGARLFIALAAAGLLALVLGAVALVHLSAASALVSAGIILIALLALLCLAACAWVALRRRPLPLLHDFAGGVVNLLFPLAIAFGSLVGLDKDRVRSSFIAVHNRLAGTKDVRVQPERVLVLLPHCLQWYDCPIKITNDVGNCKRCGRCAIASLRGLQDRYGFSMVVVTGGTAARQKLEKIRPRVVIAVACERDLASGIQDVRHIHVLGVTNERPHGPCINTSLDLTELETALKKVIL